MPSRRRPAHISATALPASRLPLGTPKLTGSESPQSLRTANHSPPRLESRISNTSSDRDIVIDTGHHSSLPNMPPKNSSTPTLTKSIAEAKLERQKKRIEEADAAMNPSARHDRRNQTTSRTKGKQWKPFDFTAETSQNAPSQEGGVLVSEVRVDRYRARSRESSLARSVSALSHHTSETGPSDMERHDSSLTDNGFQVFTGRRNKKHAGELNAYEDKPEERQTTVEATFDKREIYEVFGNALPGPEYIHENVGLKNGQVQFIQHPNGDVSSQQWSEERYMWENIGQFSNIRKKVEGQLASDRLKGETAHQTLQQNTLAYFRTIAKQREANIMGLPFGPKEILAALPQQTRNGLVAAPTGLKDTARSMYRPEPVQVQSQIETKTLDQPSSTVTEPVWNVTGNQTLPHYGPQVPRSNHFGYTMNYAQQPVKQEDPFYSGSTYQQIYGDFPYQQQYYNQQAKSPFSNSPFFGIAQRPQGLNYDFHFPPAGAANQTSQQPTARRQTADHTSIYSSGNRSYGVPGQRYPQYPTITGCDQTLLNQEAGNQGTLVEQIIAPRPKLGATTGNRASMSDQLRKISETAKERNLSQTNISRTVLYDPYQNSKASATRAEPKHEAETDEVSPIFSRHVVGKTLQPPRSFDPKSAKFFPTVLAPGVSTSTSPISTRVDQGIQQSTTAMRTSDPPADHSTPSIQLNSVPSVSTQQEQATPFVTANQSVVFSTTEPTSSSEAKKTYDEELEEWWTSGNKFMRQEEFYESTMAVHKPASTTGSPPAHLTPIGPPSRSTPKKQDPAPFNPTTTRLLIPVLENLASYVQGPLEKRRDYFSQWSQPPEWCIDRSEGGNDSFFDSDWGQPPARVGRDPRYSNRSWTAEHSPQVNRFAATSGPSGNAYASGANTVIGSGLDRRFGFGGQY